MESQGQSELYSKALSQKFERKKEKRSKGERKEGRREEVGREEEGREKKREGRREGVNPLELQNHASHEQPTLSWVSHALAEPGTSFLPF